MTVKTVIKYVLLVLVAFLAVLYVISAVMSINNMVSQGMNGNSVGLFLFSLTALVLHVLGLYGIFKERFTSSVVFSVVLVLCLIGTIFLSVINTPSVSTQENTQKVFMVYVISVLMIVLPFAIFTAMMISYTIMIRKKTPVEGSIAYTKNIA